MPNIITFGIPWYTWVYHEAVVYVDAPNARRQQERPYLCDRSWELDQWTWWCIVLSIKSYRTLDACGLFRLYTAFMDAAGVYNVLSSQFIHFFLRVFHLSWRAAHSCRIHIIRALYSVVLYRLLFLVFILPFLFILFLFFFILARASVCFIRFVLF